MRPDTLEQDKRWVAYLFDTAARRELMRYTILCVQMASKRGWYQGAACGVLIGVAMSIIVQGMWR